MPLLRHAYRVIFALAISLTAGIVLLQPLSHPARADDAADDDAEKQAAKALKERFTNWMRTYVEGTRIRISGVAGANEEQMPELVPNPVFRYSDEVRSIPDGTLWVWTRNARPVAFQKVEAKNNRGGSKVWTVCFASLSEGLINVDWPMDRNYAARKPGVTFSPIAGAEAPADTPRARTAQLKALKERFTGRLFVRQDGTGGAESRTMPKPIFEYADPNTKLPLGAIFGMSSTGTNPDLLLLIEARRDGDGKWRWESAHARMTSSSVRMRLDDTEIWSEPDVNTNNQNSAFENWTFYYLNRDF